MTNKQVVPIIDIGPLFQDDAQSWQAVDTAISHAAQTIGAFAVTGMPAAYQVNDEEVAQLHQFFSLPQTQRDALGMQNYNSANSHKWRGYSATLKGGWAHNEIYDIGSADPVSAPPLRGAEILTEPNVWPDEEPFAGWQAAMLARWQQMHQLSLLIFRSLVRGLGGDAETAVQSRFAEGNATLRLLNYPKKPEDTAVGGQANATRLHDGVEQPLLTVEHDDSCCLSLLWQDPKGGLQIQTPAGEWLAVPKVAGGVSVHFGDALQPLTADLLRPTPHRVLGHGDRQSMGFFFEPDFTAELSPLPGLGDSQPAADTYALALLKVLVRRGMYVDLIDIA